ncbi:MAG: AbrB/MazE/SpoVT family DNA-binding domain-containing protein [Rhizobiaceae bacterium]|mgnify:CR=1 FL=1|nr:AbrB/MazE/SpoVT family DNA-binding domain-containing protein [Rhizobiaceae bacterium]
MGMVKHAKVFRNGRNRAVRIPVEFDFPGDDVTITKEGSRIIIEPVEQKTDLLEWLKTIEPWDEEFPDVDEDLLPLEDVEL